MVQAKKRKNSTAQSVSIQELQTLKTLLSLRQRKALVLRSRIAQSALQQQKLAQQADDLTQQRAQILDQLKQQTLPEAVLGPGVLTRIKREFARLYQQERVLAEKLYQLTNEQETERLAKMALMEQLRNNHKDQEKLKALIDD